MDCANFISTFRDVCKVISDHSFHSQANVPQVFIGRAESVITNKTFIYTNFEPAPECILCQYQQTVKHVLVD